MHLAILITLLYFHDFVYTLFRFDSGIIINDKAQRKQLPIKHDTHVFEILENKSGHIFKQHFDFVSIF